MFANYNPDSTALSMYESFHLNSTMLVTFPNVNKNEREQNFLIFTSRRILFFTFPAKAFSSHYVANGLGQGQCRQKFRDCLAYALAENEIWQWVCFAS